MRLPPPTQVSVAEKDSSGISELVSDERMCDAVDIILSYQNSGGGFSSFEPVRGPQALEMLNAAEVFGESLLI